MRGVVYIEQYSMVRLECLLFGLAVYAVPLNCNLRGVQMSRSFSMLLQALVLQAEDDTDIKVPFQKPVAIISKLLLRAPTWDFIFTR